MLELLTVLNSATSKLEIGSGGEPSTIRQEVAGALAGISIDGINILLAKYSGDERSLEALCRSVHKQDDRFYPLYRKSAEIAIKWKMTGDKRDKIRRLLNICIIEQMDIICPTCKGHRVYKSEPCKTCRETKNHASTGKYRFRDDQKAAAIGISKAAYCQYWKPRHAEITRLVQDVESEAIIKFVRNMKSPIDNG